ncbi:hypothetical protein J3L16_11470 [Alteromonas sp. 5E99-2]|uniref:hypothetical protein n=1 Tax=Alteromonas sp. 5E99-2 TaxID=2817683 RepID=UPI001A99EA46|nr:hypothetical protein [Alteromonas sp. 5E99-2]MBO1256301.1 hypothetical protein [Alteromonas sp. 5E99-2]
MHFRDLGESLDQAISANYLPDIDDDIEQVKLYRRRLHLLKYIDRDTGENNLDSKLRDAITQFQIDVGISVSGNPDHTTFFALGSLVAFEPPEGGLEFIDGLTTNNPALIKAIKLKLSCFGIKVRRNSNINASLHQFRSLLLALMLPNTKIGMTNKELLPFLFDIDLISSGVKGDKKGFHFRFPQSISRHKREQFKDSLDIFLRNTAAIELWLYGYPIALSELRNGNVDLKKALKLFWKETPEMAKPQSKYRDRVTYDFFVRINFLQQNTANADIKTINAAIDKKLKNDESFKLSTEQESHSLISRIIDGGRRLFRGLVAVFRGFIKGVSSLVKNATRWILSKGRTHFIAMKNVIKAGLIGFKQIKPSENIIVLSDYDRDQTVIVSSTGDINEAKIKMTEFTIRSQLRIVGIKGFVWLFKVFRSYGSLFAAGWIRALWSLTKIGERFEELQALNKEATKLLKIAEQNNVS